MILIIGVTGNTGKHVVNLIKENEPHTGIVGTTRQDYSCENVQVENVQRYDETSLRNIFSKYPIKYVVQTAHTTLSPVVMDVSEEFQVRHVVCVHTTGIFSKYRSCSEEYVEVENALKSKNYKVPYTILRPTLIYGNPEDRNMAKLIRFLAKSPVFPLFGDGSNLFQPVHVADLASAVYNSIGNPKAYGKEYNISGKTVITYKEIIKMISHYLEKKVIVIPIPVFVALSGVWMLNHIFRKKWIITEQVKRMKEDKAFSYEEAMQELNYSPRSFEEGIRAEIPLVLNGEQR